jgi:hypothetical protein
MIAKRLLTSRLAAMRQDSGLKPGEVDDRLGWKRGRLVRIEHGNFANLNPSFARDLMRVYDPPARVQAEIMDLVEGASVRSWWRKYSQPGDPDKVFDSEYPGYEADASQISVYAAQAIPDLLQTDAYIDLLSASAGRSERWRTRLRESCLRRQAILDRTDGTAPRLIAVISEASLLYWWKPDEDRRAQVRHLAEASRRPNIELRLLRFEDGHHGGMNSRTSIFDFPGDQDPRLVFLGDDHATRELGKPEEAQSRVDAFTRIRRAALAAPLTTEYLDNFAGTLA